MKIENFEEIPVGIPFERKPKKICYIWTFIFGLLTGDLNPAHINIFTFRKDKTKFKGLIAHGISTVARAEGYILKIFEWTSSVETVAKGYRDIKYYRPVFMGDTIKYTYTVIDKKITTGRCDCTWLIEAFNQKNKKVFSANWEIVYFPER